jgi:hypothetical protein
MSTVRPLCLRPMLSRKAYREFALKINDLVGWEQFGYEMLLFYFVLFFFPPLAALFMVRDLLFILRVNFFFFFNFVFVSFISER